jgi:hypothetical protein
MSNADFIISKTLSLITLVGGLSYLIYLIKNKNLRDEFQFKLFLYKAFFSFLFIISSIPLWLYHDSQLKNQALYENDYTICSKLEHSFMRENCHRDYLIMCQAKTIDSYIGKQRCKELSK